MFSETGLSQTKVPNDQTTTVQARVQSAVVRYATEHTVPSLRPFLNGKLLKAFLFFIILKRF